MDKAYPYTGTTSLEPDKNDNPCAHCDVPCTTRWLHLNVGEHDWACVDAFGKDHCSHCYENEEEDDYEDGEDLDKSGDDTISMESDLYEMRW